jgi:DNA-binding response OmpR family regulator
MPDAPDERPTVLVVEDEALIASLVSDVLAEAGYRPVWTPDGRAALAGPGGGAAAAAAARAAVVDLRLADGLDGRDVLRRLRERCPSLPAVVTTGFDPRAPEADLRGLGGPTARLGKPFDGDALLERLAGVLGGPATPAGAAPARFRRPRRGCGVSRGGAVPESAARAASVSARARSGGCGAGPLPRLRDKKGGRRS